MSQPSPTEYTAQAILSDKRMRPNGNGMYVVTVTCSACRHSAILTFSGWSGGVCQGCRAGLERTPYRKGAK